MTGNPFITGAPFYKLMWSDLQSQMPFATDMQCFEAAGRLQTILNEYFTEQARKLAYEFEARNLKDSDE